MKILFLDDEQIRHDRFDQWLIGYPDSDSYNVTHVYTADGAIDKLNENMFYEEIWLDHDLGSDDKESGMKVVNFLCQNPIRNMARIMIHSMNPICSKEMMLRLKDAGYRAERTFPP